MRPRVCVRRTPSSTLTNETMRAGTRQVRRGRRLRHSAISIVGALVLAAGLAHPAFAVAGDLDRTFGRDGKVTTDIIPGWALGVTTQPDGRIVAVGTDDVTGGNASFTVARYNVDGTLDSTFGGDGIVSTSFTPRADWAFGVAIQGDGKLVVAGGANLFAANWKFALARYNRNGTLDSSFGLGGRVTTDFTALEDFAHAVEIQADGKIVVSGTSAIPSSSGSNRRFALARYNPNGTLDTAFGRDGKVATDFTPWQDEPGAGGLAIQSNGKMVLTGYSGAGGPSPKFALARYTSNGRLDDSFGGNGKIRTNLGPKADFGFAVSIQTDGKILAGGDSGARNVGAGNGGFGLVRYDRDGTLDDTFGRNGIVRTNFSRSDDEVHGLAVQADGEIVAVGISGIGGPDNTKFGLARYAADGTLDAAFGGDGKVRTDFTPNVDFAFAVAIDSGGRIVTAGIAGLGGRRTRFALARYLSA
jgi:uncharacterized delta-60 repeat protein